MPHVRTSLRRTTSLALAMLAAAVAPTLAQQEWEWSGTVDRGDAVTIKGVNGEIIARRAAGSRVSVLASKSADRSDPSSVTIEVIEDSEGVLICAVYPPREGRDRNRCGRGGDHEMNVNRNDVVVDFVVEVPDGVGLNAHTVNGEIEAMGLSARVRATTVNGDVEVETRDAASATTVNGSIVVAMGSTTGGPLDFTTVNGSITLTVPDGIGADISMATVNGSFETDFPLTVQGRMQWGPRELNGEIGGGGERLALKTVNGSITLRRG